MGRADRRDLRRDHPRDLGSSPQRAERSRGVAGTERPRFEGSVLVLPRSLETAMESGHPWIYRDHVPAGFEAKSGSWVQVRAGNAEAWALWDPSSPIALRIFSTTRLPDESWVRERVAEALALRRRLVGPDTDAYRIVYGEGDGLPGVVADYYAGYVVLLTYSEALVPLVAHVARAIAAELDVLGILWRRASRDATNTLELLHGSRPPADWTIVESGLRYYADLETGQKTGLFLDQRENRVALSRFVGRGTVLNLFSYSGGFSLAAARAGASHVTSVDIATPAIERARDNFALNGFDPAAHQFVTEDCYDFLAKAIERRSEFDLVVCDPPSLGHSRAQLETALKAYTLLNARAIRCTKPGGFLAASSCTSQVSPEAFRNMLGVAARRAERRLQIVHEAGHAVDHPHWATHPEGRYLKFVVGRVLERS